MTRFLASVRDADEAAHALAAGADIIDLKDPGQGALGAVALDIARSCVADIDGLLPVSATVGDLPMEPPVVCEAVAAMAGCGVADVKLGVPRGGDPQGCFAALAALSLPAGLILVFFADAMADIDPVMAAEAAGARGIMLDTSTKGAGALPDHMSLAAIARFVNAAQRAGLMAGVAGSLQARHVAPLLALSPDVIGFRGALCRNGKRHAGLDPTACRRIRALIPGPRSAPEHGFGEPHASAVC